MDIMTSINEGIYLVEVSGRWDAYSANEFEQKCTNLIEEGMRNVVFDLSAVDYISSFGLRSLLNIGKKLDPLAGNIVVSNMSPTIYKLFVGSGFANLFPAFDSSEEAHEHLKSKIYDTEYTV